MFVFRYPMNGMYSAHNRRYEVITPLHTKAPFLSRPHIKGKCKKAIHDNGTPYQSASSAVKVTALTSQATLSGLSCSPLMSLKTHSPLGSAAIVAENILIVLMSAINFTLLVLFSSAMNVNTTFLVLPFTIEWFTLVIVIIYLMVRASGTGNKRPSLSGATFMFATQTFFGLVNSLALTDRAWPGPNLCDDLGRLSHSCPAIALAVVGLSWLGTTTASAGILLSCAGPLHRAYRALGIPRRHDPASIDHIFELVDIPTRYHDQPGPSYDQPSYNKGKGKVGEEWIEIPI
ncbi:hypothetical protein C8R45DRAFT_589587 [Mycena sanguinolenta]|nr:hypothetical protein C8R45DRAFT_589587 [Mycena sanguinolenta]